VIYWVYLIPLRNVSYKLTLRKPLVFSPHPLPLALRVQDSFNTGEVHRGERRNPSASAARARAAAMGWMIKQRTLIDYATTWLPRHRIGSKGAPD